MKEFIDVFVYGTLKVGGRFSHAFDDNRKSVEDAVAKGTMFDVHGSYPCIVLEGDKPVHGELHTYDSPEDVIKDFDRIEGFQPGRDNNLYNRKEIMVTTASGETKKAIVYEFASPERASEEFEVIEDGRWEI